MYRISLVSYSNTLPFKEALYNSEFILKNAILQERNPALCAEDIFTDKADISLMPIGAFPIPKNLKIISDYCLAAKNKVESVLLVSQKEKEKIKTVILDYQSRSSVKYIKILAEKFWNLNYLYQNAEENFLDLIEGDTAAVVIGDRALNIRNSVKFKYDIAEEWFKFTGKPALFAVWIANNKVDENFIAEFNKVLKFGVENRKQIAHNNKHLYKNFDLIDYLTNCMDYYYDENKQESLKLFEQLYSEIIG
ncbi:MAG: menaquinone biosynthesis protein [Bacteroidales bacterium]|nr:menaquinone biosynthesis protein [Bacteroidales bacterium]MCK9498517.1 menaquinone biosynthesis protein [Bacteroidales bacterium]MDY0314262.1 menaquinone biosynthesis protein [Bacteroidales bacterium]NLB86036.1 menaquinone biosynthesis protein [Bacteroidales bacterium]